MSYFYYKAKDLSGDEIIGEYYGEDYKELTRILRKKGYFLIKIKKRWKYTLNFIKITSKDLSTMCKQLASMLMSGINISEAFTLLTSETKNKKLKSSLVVIKNEIHKGKEISYSMGNFKKIYPDFMINMIRIGEQSGNLDIVLNKLSEYYTVQNKFWIKIKKAMTYPTILFTVTNIVLALMAIKVIPIFNDLFISLSIELPALTKFFMATSYLIKNNICMIIILNLFIIAAIFRFRSTETGILFIDKLKLNMPFIGNLYKKMLEVKFIRGLSLLIESGVTILKSMDIVIKIINSRCIEKKLNYCIQDIKNGKSITRSMEKTKFFEPIVLSMVRIGEESGNLSEMLNKSADILEEEVSDTIDIIAIYIEPFLTIFIAILVTLIILSLMLPMMQLMQNIDSL